MLKVHSRVAGFGLMLVVGFLLASAPAELSAYTLEFPQYAAYEATVSIAEPTQPHVMYSELKDFPHTYMFALEASSSISLRLNAFSAESSEPQVNFIVVKKNPNGSVTEMTRASGRDMQWKAVDERMSSVSYLTSELFKAELSPGEYLLEVNSADNQGKYGLELNEPTFGAAHPWQEIKRAYGLQRFVGKSMLAALSAPIFALPLIFVFLSAFLFVYRRHQKMRALLSND